MRRPFVLAQMGTAIVPNFIWRPPIFQFRRNHPRRNPVCESHAIHPACLLSFQFGRRQLWPYAPPRHERSGSTGHDNLRSHCLHRQHPWPMLCQRRLHQPGYGQPNIRRDLHLGRLRHHLSTCFLGRTNVVSCTATNRTGTNSCTFLVTVQDVEPPDK